MNNIRNIESITEQELKAGIYGGLSKGSWHEEYKDSAWVFLGGFPFELSEGDIICVMSQWGEIEDINLVRDKVTNKSKGFAFIKYEDNRSTILAVDNFNGTTLLKRTLRCDHVQEYRLPKEVREREMEALEEDPDAKVDIGPGHAYKDSDLKDDHNVSKGVDLWKKEPAQVRAHSPSPERQQSKKHKHDKKESKEHKAHKHDKKHKEHKHDKDREKEHKHKSAKKDKYDRDGRREDLRERHHDRSTAAAYSAPVAVATTSTPKPTVNVGASSFQTSAAASWRGNRDPVAPPPSNFGNGNFGNKRPYEGNGSGGGGGSGGNSYGGSSSGNSRPRTDPSVSGIGGFNRVR